MTQPKAPEVKDTSDQDRKNLMAQRAKRQENPVQPVPGSKEATKAAADAAAKRAAERKKARGE